MKHQTYILDILYISIPSLFNNSCFNSPPPNPPSALPQVATPNQIERESFVEQCTLRSTIPLNPPTPFKYHAPHIWKCKYLLHKLAERTSPSKQHIHFVWLDFRVSALRVRKRFPLPLCFSLYSLSLCATILLCETYEHKHHQQMINRRKMDKYLENMFTLIYTNNNNNKQQTNKLKHMSSLFSEFTTRSFRNRFTIYI